MTPFAGGQGAGQERSEGRVDGQRTAVTDQARGGRQEVDAQQPRVDSPGQTGRVARTDPCLCCAGEEHRLQRNHRVEQAAAHELHPDQTVSSLRLEMSCRDDIMSR
jgi:hypothetical protein